MAPNGLPTTTAELVKRLSEAYRSGRDDGLSHGYGRGVLHATVGYALITSAYVLAYFLMVR